MTSKEEIRRSENSILIRTRALLLIFVMIAALFATVQTAGAKGVPTKLIVFTDKKVYTDAYNDPRSTDADNPLGLRPVPGAAFTENFSMILYAIVLDDEGNILPGNQSANFTLRTVDDVKLLDHGDRATTSVHHDTVTNNPSFLDGQVIVPSLLDNGLKYDTKSNDGIYTSYIDLPDYTIATGGSGGSTWKYWKIGNSATRLDATNSHLLVAVNVTYNDGVNTPLNAGTYILLTQYNCHQGAEGDHPNAHIGSDGGATTGEPCDMCHIGYDHLYNYKNFSEFPTDFGDVAHANKLKPPAEIGNVVNANSADIVYNTTLGDYTEAQWQMTTWSTFLNQGDTSNYCYVCHFNSGSEPLDYGYGAARTDLNDRPSCSVASKSLRGGTAVVTCHATTNITATDIIPWNQSGANTTHMLLDNLTAAKSHNHSTSTANLPCAGCHLTIHSLILPNKTSDNNINNQCKYCHSNTGPKNSTKLQHSSTTTDCKQCHKNATGALDAHLVPEGVAGGVNCTECHNMGGSVNNVNFTTVNKGMHANLNKNASSSAQNATNKPCWACHGTINATSGLANYSDQPADSHNQTVYKTPRQCQDCHITGNLRFNATNVTDHIPSGYSSLTDVNTSSYNYTVCTYCHNNSVNYSNDTSMGLTLNGNPINASVSHYGANKTAGKLMSATNNSTDCVYCHRNNSNMAAWGIKQSSPANISNKNGTAGTRTNHSDYTTSGKCKYCHGNYIVTASLTFHDAPLDNGSFGPDCKSCHDIGGIATGKLVNFSTMNATDAIHKNLNYLASATVDVENKKCWACHTTNGTQPQESSNHSIVNRYANPYNCTDCHVQGAGQNFNYTPNTTLLNVTRHYRNGNNIDTPNAATCYDCHNKSVMMIAAYDPDRGNVYGGANGGNNSTSHYGKKRADMLAQQNTAQYCYNCHNGSSVFPFIDNANRTIDNHTELATNPGCVDDNCHNAGRIHDSNLTKPVVNTTLCNYCHTNKARHNNSIECKECHLETNRSIHPVQYLQPDNTWKINSAANKTTAANCTNCHQSVLSSSFSTAPIIPNTLKHSSNLSNGSLWNTTAYWNTQQGSCYYCHNDTIHNATALGMIDGIRSADTNNTRNGTITATTWCIDCHLNAGNSKYKGSQWSPVPPLITVNNTFNGNWEDHSSYLGSGIKDKNCEACHAQNITAAETSLNYSHSLDEGVAGSPNCIQCHNVVTGLGGGAPSGINFTAFNLSIHFGMNALNSTTNGACWACHDSDGNITSGHGDRQKIPKQCDECHIGSGTYNASAYNAPVVGEHYYGGTNIRAGNSSSNLRSCINCHENISGMIQYNNDTDTGTSFTGDGIRLNGGNQSAYHYGKDRTDLRTLDSGKATNCSYCHQDTNTVFNITMTNAAYNSSIQNHSGSNAPGCTNSTCHASGWIHNATLTKPALPLPNTTYCQNCHGTKNAHNGTQQCTKCHVNTSSSDTIHPIRYIQTTGSFGTSKATAANCTNCHQQTGLTNFSTAPIVPEPVKHSTDQYSGKKWGSYWDNTSEITACYYCHQNEIHKSNTALLGNVSTIKGSNTFNNPDITKSRWCVNCHYAGAPEYAGSLLLTPPPEITNSSLAASDGTSFYNHSTDVASDYNDSKCIECHGLVGSYTSTTLNFSHSLNEGGGGPDCVSSGCHGSIGSSTSPFMNWTSLKSGMHSKLNSGADTTGMTDTIDVACWACHGDGTKPSGHPTNYKQPYNCTACHLASGSISGKYQAKNVSQHQHLDAQVRTNSTYARCEDCHNNSLVNYFDNETSALTNYILGNVSHYGANKTSGKLMYNSSGNSEDCVYCHLNNSNRQKWANATNASVTKPDIHSNYNVTTQNSVCWDCHVDGKASSVTAAFTLHNASVNSGASEFCLNCHVVGGSAENLKVTSERMGAHIDINLSGGSGNLTNSDCWSCHYGYPNGTTGSHSYNVSSQDTYYCEDCHGPAKNSTAVSKNLDAGTNIISEFQHASLDCAGCHAANDSRRLGGSRVSIYHNSSAKLNATGVVSNPGWDMINGLYADCNDCHRIQNTRTGPFRGPGYLHYTTTASNCGDYNCHAYDNNPHFQVYQPCYDFPTCYLQPSVSPPSVSNLNLTSPVVNKTISTTTLLTAKAWDNYNIIENAKYRISNSSGIVVNWTEMDPSGGRWGPSRLEQIRATIDTSNPDISPGLYTVEVKAMAGGPRTKPGRYYPDNGEWSSIVSIMLEVKQ